MAPRIYSKAQEELIFTTLPEIKCSGSGCNHRFSQRQYIAFADGLHDNVETIRNQLRPMYNNIINFYNRSELLKSYLNVVKAMQKYLKDVDNIDLSKLRLMSEPLTQQNAQNLIDYTLNPTSNILNSVSQDVYQNINSISDKLTAVHNALIEVANEYQRWTTGELISNPGEALKVALRNLRTPLEEAIIVFKHRVEDLYPLNDAYNLIVSLTKTLKQLSRVQINEVIRTTMNNLETMKANLPYSLDEKLEQAKIELEKILEIESLPHVILNVGFVAANLNNVLYTRKMADHDVIRMTDIGKLRIGYLNDQLYNSLGAYNECCRVILSSNAARGLADAHIPPITAEEGYNPDKWPQASIL